MNKEIKNKARNMIQGIRFNLFLPILVISLLSILAGSIFIGFLISFVFIYMNRIFIYKFVRTGKRDFKDMFDDYKSIDNLVLLIKANFKLLLYIICFILILALIIVGTVYVPWMAILLPVAFIPMIMVLYTYFAVPFILKDSGYKLSIKYAFELSREIMAGKKVKLFTLQFSFIFHHLLNMITFGIYSIWLTPYILTSEAMFYIAARDDYLLTHKTKLSDYIRPALRDNVINGNQDENAFDNIPFETADEVLNKNENNDVIFEEIKEDNDAPIIDAEIIEDDDKKDNIETN